MNIPIKNTASHWLNNHPKTKQWLWFITLWLGGLGTVFTITYPIKILIRMAS